MAAPVVDSIIGILKEGLSLWRTYLDKRKELYEISLSKKRNKALNISEEAFDLMDEFIQLSTSKGKFDEKTELLLHNLSHKISKKKKEFSKFD